VDFLLTDIVPPSSGSDVERGARTARAVAAPGPGGSRKSFSAVLHGVRGEEQKRERREADDVRSTNKSDGKPHSKETKDRHPFSAQTERTEASSSQGQPPHGSGSNDDEKRVAEDSIKAPESTNQPSNVGPDSQGQVLAPLLSSISPQVLAQANDQSTVHMEGEGHVVEGDHVSEREAGSDVGFSKSPSTSPNGTNSPMAVSDPAESSAPPANERRSPHDPQTHEPDAPVIHATSDSRTAQAVKPGVQMVSHDVGTEIADRIETRPALPEAQTGSALSQSEAIARPASHTQLGAGAVDGKAEILKTDSVIRDEVPPDRSTATHMRGQVPPPSKDEDIRAMIGGDIPQGQQSNFEGTEHFSEFWSDHHNSQQDQAKTKLPQAAVVDRHVTGGLPTESIMAGAYGGVVSSPPPPPPTAPLVGHAQPAMPAHDAAEPARLAMRSVVFDVAQPDLGHVNIRVAMANDVVHTHFSTDRPEVGQFLVNGQDRLQAALQANGLDLGQFRVDIDRQSAGRSFQHGPSQEQGQTWNQGSERMKWEQSPDRLDEPHMSLQGLLNVVA